jgi:hypothetical protein
MSESFYLKCVFFSDPNLPSLQHPRPKSQRPFAFFARQPPQLRLQLGQSPTVMAALAPNTYQRHRRDPVRQQSTQSGGPVRTETVPIEATRLGRLYLLSDCHRNHTVGVTHNESVLRLLGVQNGWVLAVAGFQNAEVALRILVVRNLDSNFCVPF